MSRPKSKNPKKIRYDFRMTEDLKRELDEIAEKKGLSVAALMTMYLWDCIDREKSK